MFLVSAWSYLKHIIKEAFNGCMVLTFRDTKTQILREKQSIFSILKSRRPKADPEVDLRGFQPPLPLPYNSDQVFYSWFFLLLIIHLNQPARRRARRRLLFTLLRAENERK